MTIKLFKCSRCNEEKPITKYRYRKDRKCYFTICRDCENRRNQKYYQNNKTELKKKHKEYYFDNIDTFKNKYRRTRKENGKNRIYYLKNKEHILENRKKYVEKNKEEIKEKRKVYYQKNKQIIKKRNKAYLFNKRKTDLNQQILDKIRTRIYGALKRKKNIKTNRTCELVGCSISELKLYLESKFKPGMTWDNYGEWHVDHIRPCASFNLTNMNQQKQCFHYSNLQPLWAKENMSKGKKIL